MGVKVDASDGYYCGEARYRDKTGDADNVVLPAYRIHSVSFDKVRDTLECAASDFTLFVDLGALEKARMQLVSDGLATLQYGSGRQFR